MRVAVGLLHLLEELPGVGRERLDVAPLPLGVERVEGERRLARAGEAGDDDEPLARDVDVDVLEIVLAGAADDDAARHGRLPAELARAAVGHRLLDVRRYSASCAARLGLEAHDQHRLRVRRAHQAPAVGKRTRTPSMSMSSRPSARKRSRTRSATRELDRRRGSRRGSRAWSAPAAGRRAARDSVRPVRPRISSRRRAGVDRVVEAEVAVREEDVAAHLAAEQRARLPHLRLDERVAGLPHDAACRRAARCRRRAAASTSPRTRSPRPGCAPARRARTGPAARRPR